MGMTKVDQHDELTLRRTMKVYDDFRSYSSGGEWTSVLAGAATISAGDGLGGILTLSCVDSTINREVYLKQTNQVFTISNNFPVYAEAFLQYSEANVNEANIAFGFMSSVGSASMQDTNGEPKTSFTGAVIYKIPLGTQWKTCSSVGSTQNKNQSNTNAGGSAYVRLGILIEPVSTTIAEVTYYVNDIQLQTAGGRPGTSLIKDQLTYTGALNMALFACCKNGSTSPESLLIDYIAGEALRARFT